MKHATAVFMSLWLIVLGCANNHRPVEATNSPKPFVMSLEDANDHHRLLTGAPQTFGMRSGRVRLAPGKSVGLHSTKGNEELLVFLAGSGVARIGEGARLEVGAGKAAYIPPQTSHDVLNTGTEPLVYVFCVAPVGLSR